MPVEIHFTFATLWNLIYQKLNATLGRMIKVALSFCIRYSAFPNIIKSNLNQSHIEIAQKAISIHETRESASKCNDAWLQHLSMSMSLIENGFRRLILKR